jgi:hypothetical protein
MHYPLACYTAPAGDGDAAIEHLRTAFANDPRTREWAADDEDPDAIRDRPDWPADPTQARPATGRPARP